MKRRSLNIPTLVQRLSAPVDIAYLACLRIAFGGMLTWLLFGYLWGDVPGRMFAGRVFHFSYQWFEWVQPLPLYGMYAVFCSLLVCAACITVGLAYRVAIWVFFVLWTYYFLIDPAYYMNHYYLVGLLAFLLGLMPAHRALSIDAVIRPAIRSDTVPAWTIWAVRAQIGIVYFYGGVTKIHPDWLSGRAVRTALSSWVNARPFIDAVGEDLAVWLFSYGGLILDLTVVPGLLWRRTRWLYVILVGGFHLTNSYVFNIDIFPLLAFMLTLSYFDPGWPRRIAVRWLRSPALASPQASKTGNAGGRVSPALLAVLSLYFLLQAVVPLRHFVYPGDHNWTEEGHSFSWHLMSRVKTGRVAFVATDPKTGTNWRFLPEDYLGPRQVRFMSTDPYLILQFAHFIGDRMAAQGYGDVEVRAFSKVSLNGRPLQYFANPETDLTRIRPWQELNGWLMPLQTEE